MRAIDLQFRGVVEMIGGALHDGVHARDLRGGSALERGRERPSQRVEVDAAHPHERAGIGIVGQCQQQVLGRHRIVLPRDGKRHRVPDRPAEVFG
jgi:hypothetical protein